MKKVIPIIIGIIGLVAGLYLFVIGGLGEGPRDIPPCLDQAALPPGGPYLIAARGAPDHRPSPTWVGFTMSGVFEHTLPAYQRAQARGMSAFDAALRVSADGEVLLMEEGDVARTTDSQGPVSVLTWDAISKLDAGDGAAVPRLADLLESLDGDVIFHLRIPGGEVGLSIARALGDGLGPGVEGVIWVASTDPKVLIEARSRAPSLLPALIIDDASVWEGSLSQAKGACPLAIEVKADALSPALAKSAKAEGVAIIALEVETEEDWERVRGLGAHAGLTDFTSLDHSGSPDLPPQGMVEILE